MPEDPSDKICDIRLDDINIQIKHPDKIAKLKKYMAEFNKKSEGNNSYGFFIVGLEDMFSLGNIPHFSSEDNYQDWFLGKNKEIEKFGREHIVPMAEKMERILGIAQTSTPGVIWIGESSRLIRFGNALLFSRNNIPIIIMKTAKKISDTFQKPCHL